ncbi:MAG: 1-deoxy-D-xylulose-5-phosphate synthase [Spirochaetales bacterium]
MSEHIVDINDLKQLPLKDLKKLAADIRERIIHVVEHNGGHLASNLGIVETTIALHYVFNSPEDALVWDVSHQTYAHKILTGRNEQFTTLRQKDGISGFTKFVESEHDWFDCGHASTAISSALGLLTGRSLTGTPGKVVAIVGDGALTGGMSFEALSHAGQISKNLIIILNDNQMSINGNTGSLSRHLSRLTTTVQYQSFRYTFDRIIRKIPGVGKLFTSLIFRIKRAIKGLVFSNNLFSDLGFEYVGPLNGHNIKELINVFTQVKNMNRPAVIHVMTQKGRGFAPAEKDPVTYHGYSPVVAKTSSDKSFTEVFSDKIVSLAKKDEKIAAITAAMTDGTGLNEFAKCFPHRFFDVGIAEEHAITFAGGLSRAGMKPIVAIYSTFMQRGIDQVIHDIALQNVGAVFVLDRSGAVPADGETHQGIFDISLLRPVPNVSLYAPASQIETEMCLEWAVKQTKPIIIRYPKLICPDELPEFSVPIENGRGVLISRGTTNGKNSSPDMLFVCTGGIISEVLNAVEELKKVGKSADVYNLRFLKPLDKEYFLSVISPYKRVFFVEDGIRIGGIGTYLESLSDRRYSDKKTAVSGFPDRFLAQGTREQILDDAHLTGKHLAQKALKMWEN